MILIVSYSAKSQATNGGNFAPMSPTTAEGNKISNVPVNIFTGMPIINVPLFSYKSISGELSWNIGLSYFSGGIKVSQVPTTVGLGWYLNATGSISRTIKGVPDDLANGYINTPPLPNDTRTSANDYYDDFLDTQQDVFQFNCNGQSGKFVIGKDKVINKLEISKLKITYVQSPDNNKIVSFRITNESGIKYDFANTESSIIYDITDFVSGYVNQTYTSAWYLTQVISPFNTDTIKFNYIKKAIVTDFGYPQTTFVKNSDGTRPFTYFPFGKKTDSINKISSIILPDNKIISFLYGQTGNYVYANNDMALQKIKISDTAFRFGYNFEYVNQGRLMLNKVTPVTPLGTKDGYKFFYKNPIPSNNSYSFFQQDYWGFYNNSAQQNPPNLFPNINNYTWGADRSPNPTLNASITEANAIAKYYVPDGGFISYNYELNDRFPYIKSPVLLGRNLVYVEQSAITLNQILSNKHLLTIKIDPSVSREGNALFSGDGIFKFTIKSANGAINLASATFSMHDLFTNGVKQWEFSLPNANDYILQTEKAGNTFMYTQDFPIQISWENKYPDYTVNSNFAGGIRIKSIERQSSINSIPIIEEYKYILENGKSSGFLGDIPKYDYAYRENYGNNIYTEYTAVTSEPVNLDDNTQGSNVGYSRVEVINGSSNTNTGKTVYEFTGFNDVNTNINTSTFPYAPQQIKEWGFGLPKKVMVYDKNNFLLKKTVTNYGFDSIAYNNGNNKSYKLGKIATLLNYDNTPISKSYIAQEYYPMAGRVFPISTYDTIYQRNGSYNTGYKLIEYDTNYNAKKLISSYNKNANLQLETRYYYPYNYSISGVNSLGNNLNTLKANNIITPVVSTENWIIGDANPRLLSISTTDFSQSNFIQPIANYALQSNKPIPQSQIGNFDPAKLIRDTTLIKQQQQFTKYDSRGNLIETKSPITNKSNSAITDYKNQYTIAQVSNATFANIAYTSFEADGSGNWSIPSVARNSSDAVTGKISYDLNNGSITNTLSLASNTTYLITCWVKGNDPIYVNGNNLGNAIASHNGWSLYQKQITGVTNISISGSAIIDELRLHPIDANMVTTTYEPMIGVTSTCDQNNTIIYTEYDFLNRISIVKDKNKNIIKKYEYADNVVNLNNTTNPNWVPYYNQWQQNCTIDSIIIDNNPNSDSFNIQRHIYLGQNYCDCPYYYNSSTSAYKKINGVCELGTRVNTAAYQIEKYSEIYEVIGYTWVCHYHYEFSDGSISETIVEEHEEPC